MKRPKHKFITKIDPCRPTKQKEQHQHIPDHGAEKYLVKIKKGGLKWEPIKF